MRDFLVAVIGLAAALSVVCAAPSSNLPIVDLGYERHQAISFNESGGTYNFTNIRYAQPPVGNLRFRAPLPPKGRSSQLENGAVGRVCPQASPLWTTKGVTPRQDPRATEDCLFLDVVVPKGIFQGRAGHKRDYPTSGAPVLVWIYGGGYSEGEKTGNGLYNPAGLFHAAKDGFVYVAINYRLGALGWVAGPTLQSDGVANAGLYDQRLALKWVQQNIHLFGGDKNRVTVIGESAGGGSIMHQITAFGGLKGPAPFSQAVLQSAAWQPISGAEQQELLFQAYLKALGVGTIEEARSASSEQVTAANQAVVGASIFGSFTFGPSVDGLFVPNQPGRLLLQGSYDHNLRLLIGHNSDEGADFTNPQLTTSQAEDQSIKTFYPDLSPSVFDYITQTLYPPVFDGSFGYTSELQRAILLTADSSFTCNTYYLSHAFQQNAYNYEFAVPPGLHGQDVPYTFLNGMSPFVTAPGVATALQQYITSFALTGRPTATFKGAPAFPNFAEGQMEVQFNNDSSILVVKDEQVNPRCEWWQLALYT